MIIYFDYKWYRSHRSHRYLRTTHRHERQTNNYLFIRVMAKNHWKYSRFDSLFLWSNKPNNSKFYPFLNRFSICFEIFSLDLTILQFLSMFWYFETYIYIQNDRKVFRFLDVSSTLMIALKSLIPELSFRVNKPFRCTFESFDSFESCLYSRPQRQTSETWRTWHSSTINAFIAGMSNQIINWNKRKCVPSLDSSADTVQSGSQSEPESQRLPIIANNYGQQRDQISVQRLFTEREGCYAAKHTIRGLSLTICD